MDNVFEELERLTQSIVNRLDEVEFEELTAFVEQRGQLIHQLQLSALRESDRLPYKEKINQLLEWDARILNKMEQLRDEASRGMNQITVAKRTKNAYDSRKTADSVFFDRKK